MGYDLISLNPTVKPEGQDDTHENDYYRLIIGDEAYFNIHAWPLLLKLAMTYGWQPLGTELSGESNWDGTYFSNDLQIVTAEDAAALANALETALDDIPDHEIGGEKDVKFDSAEKAQKYLDAVGDSQFKWLLEMICFEKVESYQLPNVLLTPFEYFSGEMKPVVISFIRLCRKGAFRIT